MVPLGSHPAPNQLINHAHGASTQLQLFRIDTNPLVKASFGLVVLTRNPHLWISMWKKSGNLE